MLNDNPKRSYRPRLGFSDAPSRSPWRGVTWHSKRRCWQLNLEIRGKQFFISHFRHDEGEQAARLADLARWHLQDFFPRPLKFNFPDELPPQGNPPERIWNIRCDLLALGYPQNAPHSTEFRPLTFKSRFPGVTWNKVYRRWELRITVHGSTFLVEDFPFDEDALGMTGRAADVAHWFLQDYSESPPVFNFPEEIPPNCSIPESVAVVRRKLVKQGYPQNAPLFPEFSASSPSNDGDAHRFS